MAFREWLERPAHPAFVIIVVPVAGFSIANVVISLLTSNMILGMLAGVVGGFAGLVWAVFKIAGPEDEEPPT